ncbi:gastrotropin-like [Scyliorhinus canicula]|uniref:gastrotropin-like n=1 Tax=Scyliorhinus canicula TaxID=7830 RepID=UPI0018F2F9FC|nr:gastrotropin-like [Scyliorhinus canicula]
MAFSGKYEVASQENYDEFMKVLKYSADIIEKGRNAKVITEVTQNGNNFTWSQVYPGGKTMKNTFVIGQESEMETMDGKKFKATVQMEGNKIVCDFPNYHHTSEIEGANLVETSTCSGVAYKRISKKIA